MFSDVYDQIVQAFSTYGCPAQLFLGSQFIDQHTSTMRIVFVQAEDEYGPAVISAPQGTNGWSRQGLNPRPIGTRACGVRAELWATAPTQSDPATQYRADLAYLDALVNMLVVALQQVAAGITITSSGAAAENNGDAGRAGLGYSLTFSVQVPVIDVPWPKQQLSECSRTWAQGPGTTTVSVDAQLKSPPTSHNSPVFPVP